VLRRTQLRNYQITQLPNPLWLLIKNKFMTKSGLSVPEILAALESRYGRQEPSWPVDPYLFLVWWHCGYPASDTTCARGWEALSRDVGVDPEQLLAATPARLAKALKPGGMVPELRAQRLKEIAARVKDEFGSDLRSALVGPVDEVRRVLKKFGVTSQ